MPFAQSGARHVFADNRSAGGAATGNHVAGDVTNLTDSSSRWYAKQWTSLETQVPIELACDGRCTSRLRFRSGEDGHS